MSTNTLIALVDGSAYSEAVCDAAAWASQPISVVVGKFCEIPAVDFCLLISKERSLTVCDGTVNQRDCTVAYGRTVAVRPNLVRRVAPPVGQNLCFCEINSKGRTKPRLRPADVTPVQIGHASAIHE